MKKIKIIFIIFIIILITGCWNYRELDEMAIVSALGIDKKEETFYISAQVITTKKTTAGTTGFLSSKSPVRVYLGKGKTFQEALDDIILESPRQLYIGHIDLVVLGEETARSNFVNYLSFLVRDNESRKIFPIVVAKDTTAYNILNILTTLEEIPANSIKTTLKTTTINSSIINDRKFDKFLMCLFEQGVENSIPAIKISGPLEEGKSIDNVSTTTPTTSMEITGFAIFLEDNLVGYLNKEESLGYNIIRNENNNLSISFPCDNENNYGNLKITNMTSKITTKLNNNKAYGTIDIKGNASISEYNCELDYDKKDQLKKIENLASNSLEEILNKAIKKLQELKCDSIGFGGYLYRNKYKTWKKVDDWNELFSNMEYKIKIDLNINNIEAIISSLKEAENKSQKGGNKSD